MTIGAMARSALDIGQGTSGDGWLRGVPELHVLRIGRGLRVPGTTASEPKPDDEGTADVSALEQTGSGRALLAEPRPSADSVLELRRRSGLTWDQIAGVFGVGRRAVHFWASGRPLNAAHEERLARVLAVVRIVDRGSPGQTRSTLMSAAEDGRTALDLLSTAAFDEVVRRLGAGGARDRRPLPPLSEMARAARRPPPPEDRVGARHQTVHREPQRGRVARTVKVKREG